MAGIADLALREMPGSTRVFSISGSQGGLLCRHLSPPYHRGPQQCRGLGTGADRWVGGNDLLVGGPGRNVLTGGEDADVFVFDVTAGGQYRVTDFHPEDRVELQGFGYGSFAAVQAYLSQNGATVIFADKGWRSYSTR